MTSIKRRDGKCVDGVALFKNGGLLVASGGEVFAYDATGSKCTKIGKRGQGGLIDNGLDVCVLPNDNIAVCDWDPLPLRYSVQSDISSARYRRNHVAWRFSVRWIPRAPGREKLLSVVPRGR